MPDSPIPPEAVAVPAIEITDTGGQWTTRVHYDGRVEFADGVDATDEGRRFWNEIGRNLRVRRDAIIREFLTGESEGPWRVEEKWLWKSYPNGQLWYFVTNGNTRLMYLAKSPAIAVRNALNALARLEGETRPNP